LTPGIAWQTRTDIEARLEAFQSAPAAQQADDQTRLTVTSNEFGFVVVSESESDGRPWVALDAKKRGESIRLSPAELAAVSRLDIKTGTEGIAADLRK